VRKSFLFLPLDRSLFESSTPTAVIPPPFSPRRSSPSPPPKSRLSPPSMHSFLHFQPDPSLCGISGFPSPRQPYFLKFQAPFPPFFTLRTFPPLRNRYSAHGTLFLGSRAGPHQSWIHLLSRTPSLPQLFDRWLNFSPSLGLSSPLLFIFARPCRRP